MDFAAITILVRALEVCAKRSREFTLRGVWDSIKRDPLRLVGGTAAIRVEEIAGGIIASVRLENSSFVVKVRYSWTSSRHEVIRETIEIAVRSSDKKHEIVFEQDAVVTINGRGEEGSSFGDDEFYAEKIRRHIYENEGASTILGIGWSSPAGDWRNK